MKKLLIALMLLTAHTVFGASFSGNLETADESQGPLYLMPRESMTYSLSGFGTGTISLQRANPSTMSWETIQDFSADTSATYYNETNEPQRIRWFVKVTASGAIAATLADVDGDVIKDVLYHPYQSGRVTLSINDQAKIVAPNGIVSSGSQTITGDLSVSGEILVGDGAAGNPSIAWSAAPTLGFYRVGSTATGVAGVLGVADGTSSAPGLAFSGDLNTGVYRSIADGIGIVAGGEVMIDARAAGTIAYGSATADVHTFNGAQTVYDAADGGTYLLSKQEATGILQVTGDDAADQGGNILLYGAGHANGGDIVLRSAANAYLTVDQSASLLQLGLASTGDVAILGDALGFFGVSAAARASAYTQTYSTADKTHAARTAAALTVTDGAGTNDGTIGAIGAGAVDTAAALQADVIAAIQELADQIGKLAADQADTAQFVNSIADDLQAYGLGQ
jgi:hypothetical protein